MSCRVFIAVSIDGFIATTDGGVEWLDDIEPVEGNDLGWSAFISGIDALVMGRGSFEKVLTFGFWPYELPVVVMSSTLTDVPEELAGKVEISPLVPSELIDQLAQRGWSNLYIDGGRLISSFLNEGLIDTLTITTIPVVLGAGIPLFSNINELTWLDHGTTEVFPNGLVSTTYETRREHRER